MRYPVTTKELSNNQIENLENWLLTIKGTIENYTGRAIDDLDEMIGLLAVIASKHSKYSGYKMSDFIGSIVEQFECTENDD